MKKTTLAGHKSHSIVRAAVPFYEDLKILPYVRLAGAYKFARNYRGRETWCDITAADEMRGFYRVSMYADGFQQKFNVTIDPRFGLFLKRFVSLYYPRQSRRGL